MYSDIRSPNKMKRHSPESNNKQISVTAQLPSFPTQKTDENSNDSSKSDENLSKDAKSTAEECEKETPAECNEEQKTESNGVPSEPIQNEEPSEGFFFILS